MLPYVPDHFKIEELVPEGLIDEGIPEYILWGLFDKEALITLDNLRKHFGPAYVNTWAVGGDLHYRGYRPFDVNIGAKFSQHRFGRAFDVNFKSVEAEEVQEYIIAAKKTASPTLATKFITGLEVDVDWVHFDTRYHQNPNELTLFTK